MRVACRQRIFAVGKWCIKRGWNVVFRKNLLNGPFPMLAIQPPREASGFGLFDTVPDDVLNFGRGDSFDARRVSNFLNLKKADVSHLASVSVASVRYDHLIPTVVRERLEEVASTINMVAKQFDGDPDKTAAWFKAKNPLLGDVSPRDMIRLGRYDRLRRFIIHAMMSKPRIN